ncbi:unnamed protein product [Acanthosepion pharaonis]|uniref:Uncharacterized protein n=1 Tax=Acanthosepion pharaonis TaxID=158019 RepID=A0A812B2Y0_ACAPH|nr:unnamed protein product [Sepia pharaonis]
MYCLMTPWPSDDPANWGHILALPILSMLKSDFRFEAGETRVAASCHDVTVIGDHFLLQSMTFLLVFSLTFSPLSPFVILYIYSVFYRSLLMFLIILLLFLSLVSGFFFLFIIHFSFGCFHISFRPLLILFILSYSNLLFFPTWSLFAILFPFFFLSHLTLFLLLVYFLPLTFHCYFSIFFSFLYSHIPPPYFRFIYFLFPTILTIIVLFISFSISPAFVFFRSSFFFSLYSPFANLLFPSFLNIFSFILSPFPSILTLLFPVFLLSILPYLLILSSSPFLSFLNLFPSILTVLFPPCSPFPSLLALHFPLSRLSFSLSSSYLFFHTCSPSPFFLALHSSPFLFCFPPS